MCLQSSKPDPDANSYTVCHENPEWEASVSGSRDGIANLGLDDSTGSHGNIAAEVSTAFVEVSAPDLPPETQTVEEAEKVEDASPPIPHNNVELLGTGHISPVSDDDPSSIWDQSSIYTDRSDSISTSRSFSSNKSRGRLSLAGESVQGRSVKAMKTRRRRKNRIVDLEDIVIEIDPERDRLWQTIVEEDRLRRLQGPMSLSSMEDLKNETRTSRQGTLSSVGTSIDSNDIYENDAAQEFSLEEQNLQTEGNAVSPSPDLVKDLDKALRADKMAQNVDEETQKTDFTPEVTIQENGAMPANRELSEAVEPSTDENLEEASPPDGDTVHSEDTLTPTLSESEDSLSAEVVQEQNYANNNQTIDAKLAANHIDAIPDAKTHDVLSRTNSTNSQTAKESTARYRMETKLQKQISHEEENIWASMIEAPKNKPRHRSSRGSVDSDVSIGPEDHIEILAIHRFPGEKLGMGLSIESTGGDQDPVKNVFVQSVLPGGAADKATGGRRGVCIGDEILEINGSRLDESTYSETVTFFRQMPLRVMIMVRRKPNAIPVFDTNYDTQNSITSVSELEEPDPDSDLDAKVATPVATATSASQNHLLITKAEDDTHLSVVSTFHTVSSTNGAQDDDNADVFLDIPEGFQQLTVDIHKEPAESMGLSIMPSYGSTSQYYQVGIYVVYPVRKFLDSWFLIRDFNLDWKVLCEIFLL